MKYILKFIYIYIIYCFLYLSNKVCAESTTIQILINKPDAINKEYWKTYSSFMNQYSVKFESNSIIEPNSDVRVRFSYNEDEKPVYNENEQYAESTGRIIKQFRNSEYDMMIVDEKFLYSDLSVVKSDYIISKFGLDKFYDKHEDFSDFYLDLTNEITRENLSHHENSILNKAYHENKHLYALPFDVDFNLLYYHINSNANNNNINVNNTIVNTTTNVDTQELDFEYKSWDDLLTMDFRNSDQDLLSVAYAEKDELLDLFVEYVENKFENIYSKESENYEKLIDDDSDSLYNSFKEFIKNSSSKDIKTTMETTFEDAYQSFMNGKSALFRGKASHYHSLVQNSSDKTIGAALPPKNYDVVNANFLVINKNSKVKKEILINVAKYLTSKETQLVRAESLGSIPTFDMRGKQDYVNHYCESRPEICVLMGRMKPVDIKSVFKSEGDIHAPFMEVRFYLPEILKNFTTDANDINVEDVRSDVGNIYLLIMDKPENRYYLVFGYYILTLVFTSIAVYIMYLIYRYRNNPNIKYLSPGFCNIIMLGFIMCMISPVIQTNVKSVFAGKMVYIFDMVNTVNFFLPMLLITYRIYSIYNNNSKVNFGNKLDNKHLYSFFLMVLFVIVIIAILNITLNKFYIISPTDISNHRKAYCEFNNHIYQTVICISSYILFILSVIYMVAKIGYASKHYGEFKFAYIMIFALIAEFSEEFIGDKLSLTPSGLYVYMNIYYIITYSICTYFLLVPRLIYVISHPNTFSGDSPFTNDVTFVFPVKKFKKQKKYKKSFSSNQSFHSQNQNMNYRINNYNNSSPNFNIPPPSNYHHHHHHNNKKNYGKSKYHFLLKNTSDISGTEPVINNNTSSSYNSNKITVTSHEESNNTIQNNTIQNNTIQYYT